jgi:adenine-specific DNA-methyltransferase
VSSLAKTVVEPIYVANGKGLNGGRGLYLQWEGKRLYRQRVPTPRILEPVPNLSVGDRPDNLIVEGDNLQVLASLKPRYAGQIDVIYIDPPYNTGKEDFRYSDKRFHDPDADDSDAAYVSNEDGGRHTKWLNFMAPRLYMMWEMLNDDRGVIFVSINDIELFRLGLLLNEIFDEKNWVGTIVWKATTDNNPTRIAMEHEYILCYAKSKEGLASEWKNPDHEAKAVMLQAFREIKAQTKSLPDLKKQFAKFIKENREMLGDLFRYRHVDQRGPFVSRRNLDNPGKKGYDYKIKHPVTKKDCAKPFWLWRYPEDRMRQLLAEGRILFGKDETRIPQLKVYLEEVDFPLRSVIQLDARAGSNDLERLFGTRDAFKNPKPVNLIERLISYSTTKESIVLDAFAGSGTTGEAILGLNHRDKGRRRFILIEDGREKNGSSRFTRSLTAKRVKLAIKKNKYNDGFTFLTTGRKLDRSAIVGLERDSLANLICQADETGRGRGITRLTGHKYIIGKGPRGEAICVVWHGADQSEVRPEDLQNAAAEVSKSGLKRPFRIYGTFCRVAEVPTSWRFCQIPDEILAQMHIGEDLAAEETL